MVARLGYETYIGFGEETTFGTAVQPTKFLEYNSESMQKEITEQLIEAINGTRNYTKRVTMEESAGGSIEIPLIPSADLLLLKQLSGNNFSTTAISIGSVYQHNFKFDSVVSNTSLTFQVCRDTGTDGSAATFNFTGCRLNSVDFGVSVGGLLTVGLDIMGKDAVVANTIGTASYSANNPYTFKGGAVVFGSVSAASTTILIESFNVTVANNLIEDRSIGSATRDRLEPGMLDITGEITLRYEDETVLNYFLNQTPFYISASFVGDSITAAHNNTIEFKMYECYFNGAMPNVGGAGEILKQTMPFRSIRSDGSVGALVISVTSPLTTPAS